MRGWALAIYLLIGVSLIPEALVGQVPPDLEWTTIESANFRVTYAPGLADLARHTARRAELARVRLIAELAAPPRGKVDIVLTDHLDISNGYATPFPSNRITLFARPPADHLALSNFDDWIDLVVTHELAHIFHIDQSGPIGGGLRTIFGRAPAPWPLFPALSSPTWAIEGLATYLESRLTGAGRVTGSYNEMVLRTAVLEGDLASIDQVSGSSARWPGGMRPYIYGSEFLEYLSQVYGPEVQRGLIDEVTEGWLPAPLSFNRTARAVTGHSFTELYDEWRGHLEARYNSLADTIRARGITEGEVIAPGGYNTLHPRVGPDGRVVFASADGRRSAANLIVDPGTGQVKRLSRRNGIGPSAWLPDGALLTAQLEYDGRYHIYSDLYRVDRGGEDRLTTGSRLTEPDPAPDGRRVIAVEGGHGTNRLVIYDLESDQVEGLTEFDPAVHWAFPRWSPAGDQIAVGRWEGGEHNVVILDTLGGIVRRLTSGNALDIGPAWSPDGRYIIFGSDRTGIPNLFAYDLQAQDLSAEADGALYQVTNLLTGAFFPDPSPDGRWIYYSGYHADGFHIERIPYDPGSWRAPEPGREGIRRLALAEEEVSEPGPPSRYSPLHSLLPRFWLPIAKVGTPTGLSLGAATGGTDLVGRHDYTLAASYWPGFGLLGGTVAYTFAGLGNPHIGIVASRGWEGRKLFTNSPVEATLLQRDDEVAVSTSLLHRSYRTVAELTLAGEGVHRSWRIEDAETTLPVTESRRLGGVVAQIAFANHRSQPLSISPEDGVAVLVRGRRRWDLAPRRESDGEVRDAGYSELYGVFRGYRALDLPGYANHILALRASALWRGGGGARPIGVGGSQVSLPVRGFAEETRAGTRAWSTSLEYRFPIREIGRGAGLVPVFLDRIAGTLFLDAGNASCDGPTICPEQSRPTLISTGAELSLESDLLFAIRLRIRGGIALPLVGGTRGPSPYLLLGLPI